MGYEITLILPVRNIENDIVRVLDTARDQVDNFSAEFIVVDMASEDATLWRALHYIESHGLSGMVLQNGEGSVSEALNTGIQKAAGKYLSFVFARRLYRPFLRDYLTTVREENADFVFGATSEEEQKMVLQRKRNQLLRYRTGTELLRAIQAGETRLDIAAVMVRTAFLRGKAISFTRDCSFGYAEEFLIRCILQAERLQQAPVLLQRNTVNEWSQGKQEVIGARIFQKVDAVIRISELLARMNVDEDLRLYYREQRIPEAVMECVDILLREKIQSNAVRGLLRLSGYDKLLKSGGHTPKALRRRILRWNTAPWLYKPLKKAESRPQKD